MKAIVRALYRLARLLNDVEKLASLRPDRIGRRAFNKLWGRSVVRKLWWR